MNSDNHSAAARARIFIAGNRPNDAISALASALTEDPDDAELLRLLAQAHLVAESGRSGGSRALPAAQRAAELEPNDPWSWRLISLCQSRLSAHEHARVAARRARELGPQHWMNHTTVANADATAGAVSDDTWASVTEALRLGSSEPQVHFAAGNVARVANQAKTARSHYERTLALDPDHQGARNNLALIDLRRGNAGKAAAGFAGLLAMNPNSELALRNLNAAGFTALRIVYFVIVITLLAASALADTHGYGSFEQTSQNARIAIALVSVASVVAYVLWIRRKAGIYFGRFVRSVPATDKVLTAWALILAVSLIVIVAAVFLPDSVAAAVYALTNVLLIVSVVAVSMINSSRRQNQNRK